MERVMIFIDGSNFYHSSRISFPKFYDKIDFRKLVDALRNGRLMVASNYYNASLHQSIDQVKYWKQQKFFQDIREIPGFNVVLVKMRKVSDRTSPSGFRFVIKGDDIHIATDMVGDAYENKYDTAIIVSGDGDFAPAIQRVQKLGKKVENAYFHVSSSHNLKSICNSSIMISEELLKKCLREK